MTKRQRADSEAEVLIIDYFHRMFSVSTWQTNTCPWQEGFWQTNAQYNQKTKLDSKPWLMLFLVLTTLWMYAQIYKKKHHRML